jgi:hypothetical protein
MLKKIKTIIKTGTDVTTEIINLQKEVSRLEKGLKDLQDKFIERLVFLEDFSEDTAILNEVTNFKNSYINLHNLLENKKKELTEKKSKSVSTVVNSVTIEKDAKQN